MNEQTIGAVSKETGISRSTLLQAANRSAFPSRRSGEIILIDLDSEQFKQWLNAHWQQPRVKGRKHDQKP